MVVDRQPHISRRSSVAGAAACIGSRLFVGSSALFGGFSSIAAATENPPDEITRDSYSRWLGSATTNVSAYLPKAFDWFEAQPHTPLPSQVNTAPDKIYVTVDAALHQTGDLESNGDVLKDTGMGYESYAVIDGISISLALQTVLFYAGKPVNAAAIATHPPFTLFWASRCSLQEKGGAGNYLSTVMLPDSGIVQALNDQYAFLLRGNAVDGYVVINGFLEPITCRTTVTQSHIEIIRLSARPDGSTEWRHFFRRVGQDYGMVGRFAYAFSVSKLHAEEKTLIDCMRQLKAGHIAEKSDVPDTPCR